MTSSQSGLSPSGIFFRWFALASVFNVYLLRVALRRWHYAGPPVNHAMARVLFWAVAINVISDLILGWFALHAGWKRRLNLTLMLDTAIGLLPFLMGKVVMGQDEYSFRMFGTIYVIFLLLRLALGFTWLSWNTPASVSVPHAALYVFLSTLLVFGGCAPWIWLSSSPKVTKPIS